MRLLPLAATLLVASSASALDTAGLRLNQLQAIGTHNSYKRAIEPPLLSLLVAARPDARQLDYAHPPLGEQLDRGLLGLEIDLYHDPDGGHYADPAGLGLLHAGGLPTEPYDPEGEMRTPGFKVLHVADIDFRSNHKTLAGALAALRAWSEANPDHLPVVVTMNLKDDTAPIPRATEAVPFDAAALDALDAAIRRGLGEERLLTPDLVRGDAPTLETAVLERGWPLVDDVRGRFLWVIDERGAKLRDYVAGHRSLAGRVCFTLSEPGEPEAAFLILNNPVRQHDEIRRRVEEGYFVRTRADAGTLEARADDRSRFDAALASGAQLVSTDYPIPDKRLGNGYRVVYEDGLYARPNPITTHQEAAP